MTGYNLGNFTVFLVAKVARALQALLLPPSLPILLYYSLFSTVVASFVYSLEAFDLLPLAELQSS